MTSFLAGRRLALWSLIGVLLQASTAHSGGFRSPEECLAYRGDAHLNCLYAYIEIQQDKLTKLQEELQAARSARAQLQDQVNHQSSVSDELRRGLAQREERIHSLPQFYATPFFGYTFGGPRYYGGPFYYGNRFFGPCYGPFYPCW